MRAVNISRKYPACLFRTVNDAPAQRQPLRSRHESRHDMNRAMISVDHDELPPQMTEAHRYRQTPVLGADVASNYVWSGRTFA